MPLEQIFPVLKISAQLDNEHLPALIKALFVSSWVLNTIDKMNLSNPPAIALFPIGTGNDLARSVGYGAGSDSSENVR